MRASLAFRQTLYHVGDGSQGRAWLAFRQTLYHVGDGSLKGERTSGIHSKISHEVRLPQ